MKVLITGANGLLGQHLIKQLKADKKWEIIASGRGKNRLKDQDGYTYASVDLGNERQVNDLILRVAPDVIIHSAAMTNVDTCETDKEGCWKNNVLATKYLLQPSRQTGSFILLLSTDFIFNGENGPYLEEALPDPISYYGLSKLVAESLLAGSGLHHAIARTVLVYGVAEDLSRSNIVLWLKNSLEQKKKIKVVDDQWRTPTLVQDLATGCRLIAEKKLPGVYNISGKDMLTPYEMALKVAAHFNLNPSLIERADASSFTQTAKRPPKTGFVIDKARKKLGYEPHSFEEGLAIVEKDLAS